MALRAIMSSTTPNVGNYAHFYQPELSSMATEEQVGGEDKPSSNTDESVDYLEHEINIFRPATPFMRANLRMIFALFVIWLVFVFGPVTASYFAPEFMTETRVLGGFPLNFFLTALVAPLAALVLAGIYAVYRDRLDGEFGVAEDDQSSSEQGN